MKLNNNGWGYRDMIIYSSIIIIALVFVAVSISSFYDGLDIPERPTYNPSGEVNSKEENEDKPTDIPVDENYYLNLEANVKSATLDYLNTYSYDMSDEILNISVDTLVSFDFIEPLYDKSGANTCSGYSNVYVTSQGVYEIKPFISCGDYVTSGY